MARAYLNGIRIEMDQNATIADYEGLVGQAAAEMIQFRETWGDDDFIAISRTGDAYTLQRINGQDVIIMGPVPHAPGEPGRREDEQEDPDRYPAVCFDMQSTTSLMAGFYVCASLAWDPFRFLPIDPDRPHRTSNYRLINADGSPNQSPSDSGLITEGSPGLFYREEEDGIEPLEQIAVIDPDNAWDTSSSYSQDSHKGYFSPLSPSWMPPWKYLQDLWGTPCSGSLGNCAETYSSAPPFSGSYYWSTPTLWTNGGFSIHNSYCKDPESIYCAGCAGGNTFQWGETITHQYYRTYSNSGSLSFLGTLVKTHSGLSSVVINSTMSGYGCSSSSTKIDSGHSESSYEHACAVVRGVDGYDDDETWIAFWTEYSTVPWEYTDTISPWIFGPYNNRNWPDPGVLTTNQTYWLWIHTPEWEIKMQYAEPSVDYWPGGGSNDDVYPWDYGIYDFNGEPIFVFSVYDMREEAFVYGSAYQGEIYFSEPFPYDAQYMHDVGDPDDTDGARGRGLCSAVAHVRDRKELNEYAEE